MAKESIVLVMVMFILAISLAVKKTVLESISMLMVTFTKVNGKMT